MAPFFWMFGCLCVLYLSLFLGCYMIYIDIYIIYIYIRIIYIYV